MATFTQTESYLIEKYQSLQLDARQLGEVLGMTYKGVLNAISAERFPVHTYKCGKLRVADIRDVAAYLDAQRRPANLTTRHLSLVNRK